jgi:hypothetical protein
MVACSNGGGNANDEPTARAVREAVASDTTFREKAVSTARRLDEIDNNARVLMNAVNY